MSSVRGVRARRVCRGGRSSVEAAIVNAMAGDAAFVLGLASRRVGHVSPLYGDHPEEPDERIFVMPVVNAGTAMSGTAKTAAMADISRLTQGYWTLAQMT